MSDRLGSSSYHAGDTGGSHGDRIAHGVGGNPRHDAKGRFAAGSKAEAKEVKKLLNKPAKTFTEADRAAYAERQKHREKQRAGATYGDLPSFAQHMQHVANGPANKFYGEKAYIGSVIEHARNAGHIPGHVSDAEVKTKLVDAHRKGLLHLSRADLVGAMPLGEVQRSETTYQNASFHFVEVKPRS
jgi:hypothetical protein